MKFKFLFIQVLLQMETIKIAGGIAGLGKDTGNAELLWAQGKLWLFNLNFKNQPTLNFGNHVIHTGCDLYVFTISTRTWQTVKVPAITQEENVSEHIFVFKNQIYLILFKNFKGIHLEGLYKFNGESFEQQKFSAPPEVPIEEHVRVTAVTASGVTSNDEMILVLNGEGMRVYKLLIGEDSKAEYILTTHEEPSPMSGTATSAMVFNDQLAISYGVHGCGFRWQADRLVRINLHTNEVETIQFESLLKPPFAFNGAKATTSNVDAWVHAGGSVPIGMTGSSFDGSVWKLNDVFGDKPEWQRTKVILFEKYVVANDNELYTVADDAVTYYEF